MAAETVAEIDEAIARGEATLAGYREHLADREAEGEVLARLLPSEHP